LGGHLESSEPNTATTVTTIGERIPMVDAAARVSGVLRFTVDYELPGMLHGAILRSPFPHARIATIDTSRLDGMPGVRAVLSGANLLQACADPYLGVLVRDQTPVALDKVRYVGEPVVAVAAVDREAAMEALEFVLVEYEPLPAVFDPKEASEPGAPLIREGPRLAVPWRPDLERSGGAASNIIHKFVQHKGNIEEGFACSDVIVENAFTSPPVQHAALEPHVAVVAAGPGGATIWTACQNPFALQRQLAHLVGLPLSKIRVVVAAIGGSFGARLVARLEPIALLLSMQAGHPVRLATTPEDSFSTAVQHPAHVSLRTGVKRNGQLVAQHAVCYFAAGACADTIPNVVTRAYAATGPYRVPHVLAESSAVYTNALPSTAFRGYGITQICWAHEAQMDAIADVLGIDSLELRMRNAVEEGDEFSTGEPLPDLHYKDMLQIVARRIGWDEGTYERTGSRVRAKGLATVIKGTATPTMSNAAVRLNGDGTLHAVLGTVDMGQGAGTALAQIAADAATLPIERVVVSTPDTSGAPFDSMTAASRSTRCMGLAIQSAVEKLVAQLKSIASHHLQAPPDDLVVFDGKISVRDAAFRIMTFQDIVAKSGQGALMACGTFVADRAHDGSLVQLDPADGQGYGSAEWHPGVAACEVEVDLETGRVIPLRVHVALYVGVVVNPLLAELQVQGSTIFALGQALFEEAVYDERGQVVNRNLSDNLIPSFRDMPREFGLILHEPHATNEFQGIGETALPPVRSAITNAIARAIGKSVLQLPMTAEAIYRAIAEDS
jgi:CO/xanthine dehydrogenase Mo-binding subunit